MILKVIGWIILIIGIIGAIYSLISFYAEHKIEEEFKFMREDEKQMFLHKKKEIVKMRRNTLVMLIIGILILWNA